jgi:5-methylcytosine-specific restriction enzyme A
MSWGERKLTAGRELYRTKRWQRLRAKVLRDADYLCVQDGKRESCGVVATEVDHITPHRGNPNLFWNRSNLQAMCRSCHSQKTARGVLCKGGGADEYGMPLDPNHPWNLED